LNYIYILNYLKINNYSYYNFFFIKQISLLKKNKKVINLFFNYLIIKKKIKLFFFFNSSNFNYNFNSIVDRGDIIRYNINIYNKDLFYFFFYLNFFI